MLYEGRNDNLLGHRVLIFSENGFIEKHRATESKVGWYIERVEENEDYYFLFVRTMKAYIIRNVSFRIVRIRKNLSKSQPEK
jgi:hypothetical protein